MNIDLLKDLNEQQKKAVEIISGPILIQAGAGSGKTKTLTHKIAYLLSCGVATENSILAVTFTNKAAGEMRQRVTDLLTRDNNKMSFMPYMGTFHSICVKMLRQDGHYIGVPRSFVIFDENDKNVVIKRLLKQNSIDEKANPAKTISSIISNMKNSLDAVQNKDSNTFSPLEKIVNLIYPIYESSLSQAGALDFDDLIAKVVKLLENNDTIRQKWQNNFSHILIDEYQDTNMVQYKLIKLLVNKQQNIVVVGDDWQSIYSWRGANYRNILKFEQDFKNCAVIKLEQNYRSTKHILDVAHNIIMNNQHRSDKKLWTESEDGLPVKIIQTQNERSEAEAIINNIRNSIDEKGFNYRDFAVLYRTNSQSRVLEETFLRYGLPYQIIGGQRFYDRKEIKDIVAYLRLVFQPEDHLSFERVINVPSRLIGSKSIISFFNFKQDNDLSLEDALINISKASNINLKVQDRFLKFYDIILSVRQLVDQKSMISEIIKKIIDKLNYLDYLNDGTVQGESKQENVKELLSVAESYGNDLEIFLEEISLVSDLDKTDFSNNAVTLMTLHAAKGLEFPVVYMPGMEESLFPHSRALYDQTDMEEERRLCYVGMTRARKELSLYYATSRLLYGALLHNPPSRFLSEINTLNSVEVAGPTVATMGYKNNLTPSEPRYVPEIYVGDSISHTIFGNGQVLGIDNDIAVITFEKFGKKTLNVALAPIKKVT